MCESGPKIGSEIYTIVSIVTYDDETPFDVNIQKYGRLVWRESSFEVDLDFLDNQVRFFDCS